MNWTEKEKKIIEDRKVEKERSLKMIDEMIGDHKKALSKIGQGHTWDWDRGFHEGYIKAYENIKGYMKAGLL